MAQEISSQANITKILRIRSLFLEHMSIFAFFCCTLEVNAAYRSQVEKGVGPI